MTEIAIQAIQRTKQPTFGQSRHWPGLCSVY